MASKFVVPASTMIAGLLVWIVALILHRAGAGAAEQSPWLVVGLCLVAGSLIAYSAVRCRRVNGPRVGNIVRTVLLIVMTGISYWRLGVLAAVVLAAAAIATGVLALKAPCSVEPPQGSA
jgi:hypothetical protein